MILKKTFSEQIYDQLKQDIMNQNIRFGDKLVNRELQEKFGVSSTPIRDAINRLYQDGLVEDITKSGAHVIMFNLDAALEINEIVTVLNVAAMQMAAKKSKIESICKELEQYIVLQREYNSIPQYLEYDYQFHNIFFEFAKNQRYKQLYARYHSLWEMLVTFYYHDNEKKPAESITQHEQILEAYKKGDVKQAQIYVEQHYGDAVSYLNNMLK